MGTPKEYMSPSLPRLPAALRASVAALVVLACGPSAGSLFAQGDPHPPTGVPGAKKIDDWPQWRGVNRDGLSLEKGLLKKWPEQGPPMLYVFKEIGDGCCPPTIVGNRAYISGKVEKNEAWLFAFELPPTPATPATGTPTELPSAARLLWKQKYGLSCNSGENAAPVVVGDRVYITSGDGDVAAFTTEGKMLWSHNMRKDFKAHIQTNSSYGFSESPLIDGNKLIICPGTAEAAMVAYDRESGELLWKAANPNGGERDAASHCSTMLSNAAGVQQYVNLTGWGLIGVSPEGKFLWGYKRTCESSIPTPIIRGDHVFAISAYGFGSVLLKLESDGSGGIKPKEVYKLGSEVCQNLCGQAVLIGDHVYVGHGLYAGVPVCIDFLTGKVMWRAPKQTGSGVSALIAADGMLYFRNESKEVLMVEATPKEYNLVSKFTPPSRRPGYTPPVVAHGLMFIRDKDLVMVYDLRQH